MNKSMQSSFGKQVVTAIKENDIGKLESLVAITGYRFKFSENWCNLAKSVECLEIMHKCGFQFTVKMVDRFFWHRTRGPINMHTDELHKELETLELTKRWNRILIWFRDRFNLVPSESEEFFDFCIKTDKVVYIDWVNGKENEWIEVGNMIIMKNDLGTSIAACHNLTNVVRALKEHNCFPKHCCVNSVAEDGRLEILQIAAEINNYPTKSALVTNVRVANWLETNSIPINLQACVNRAFNEGKTDFLEWAAQRMVYPQI